MCDVVTLEGRLKELECLIRKQGYTGDIELVLSQGTVPSCFYDATVIVGATNLPDCLDVSCINRGTIVVDDSIPHCFNVDLAKRRMAEKKDVLFTEGGMLKAKKPIKEWRFSPSSLDSLQANLPQLYWKRDVHEITSFKMDF